MLPILLALTIAIDLSWLLPEYSKSIKLLDPEFFFLFQFGLLGIWITHRVSGIGYRLLILSIVLTIYSHAFATCYKHISSPYSGVVGGVIYTSSGKVTDLSFSEKFLIFLVLSAICQSGANIFLSGVSFGYPRYAIHSLLMLSTALAILTRLMTLMDLDLLTVWRERYLFLYVPLVVATWHVSHWKNQQYRSNVLLLLWFLYLLPATQFDKYYQVLPLIYTFYFLWSISFAYLMVLVWSFGLQYRCKPTSQKREQGNEILSAD